jgi:hypothetical protein
MKDKQIACTGIKPLYDGSPQELIPTLNAIHIRSQNESWYRATFILQDGETLDLVRQFSKVKHNVVLNQARLLWADLDSNTQ